MPRQKLAQPDQAHEYACPCGVPFSAGVVHKLLDQMAAFLTDPAQ